MASLFNDIYTQLPSPPLSPTKLCLDDKLFEQFIYSDEELKNIETLLSSPVDSPVEFKFPPPPPPKTKEEILRDKYMAMMEEGMEVNGEILPFPYVIEKLHRLGNKVINKKTKDAVPLRVYETGKDIHTDFWAHPMYLTAHSFQFFKLFEEIKENNEQGIVEIEVPSLKAFAFVLYYIYTGDNTKIFEMAKLDETICKGIMEDIECLEVNMAAF